MGVGLEGGARWKGSGPWEPLLPGRPRGRDAGMRKNGVESRPGREPPRRLSSPGMGLGTSSGPRPSTLSAGTVGRVSILHPGCPRSLLVPRVQPSVPSHLRSPPRLPPCRPLSPFPLPLPHPPSHPPPAFVSPLPPFLPPILPHVNLPGLRSGTRNRAGIKVRRSGGGSAAPDASPGPRDPGHPRSRSPAPLRGRPTGPRTFPGSDARRSSGPRTVGRPRRSGRSRSEAGVGTPKRDGSRNPSRSCLLPPRNPGRYGLSSQSDLRRPIRGRFPHAGPG